jgi:hypothetical protein
MPRRPTKVTQADIARAIRAAKDAGAHAVTIDSNGVIQIVLATNAPSTSSAVEIDQGWAPSEALQRYLKRSESG